MNYASLIKKTLTLATPFQSKAEHNVQGWERAGSVATGVVMVGKGLRRGGFVGLIGVQSNQFPRAMDLARRFRAADVPVVIGGFHVSGSLSMLPGMQISVTTRTIAGGFSSLGRASSADAHSITRTPRSEIASAIKERKVSSSSMTSTVVGMMLSIKLFKFRAPKFITV